MKRIFKYPLDICDVRQAVQMPALATPRRVAMQGTKICIWAEVIDGAPLVERHFIVAGTGHPVDDATTYIGTVDQLPFVWHVFEVQS